MGSLVPRKAGVRAEGCQAAGDLHEEVCVPPLQAGGSVLYKKPTRGPCWSTRRAGQRCPADGLGAPHGDAPGPRRCRAGAGAEPEPGCPGSGPISVPSSMALSKLCLSLAMRQASHRPSLTRRHPPPRPPGAPVSTETSSLGLPALPSGGGQNHRVG